MNKRNWTILLLIIGSWALLFADGQSGLWKAEAGIVGGSAPTALGLRGQATYAHPLYSGLQGMLWDSARVEIGVEGLANPSFTQVAGRLMVEPIAVFDLTVTAGVRTHYNTFGFGLAPLNSYEDALPSVDGGVADGVNASGAYVAFSPTLKAAVGRVLAANTLTLTRYSYGDSAPPIFEEPVSLRPVARRGWAATNNALVLVSVPAERLTFLAFGVEHNTAWSPFVAAPAANQRLAVAGIAVVPLTSSVDVQIAAFGGSYLPGRPDENTPVYSLVAATLRWNAQG